MLRMGPRALRDAHHAGVRHQLGRVLGVEFLRTRMRVNGRHRQRTRPQRARRTLV